jgi:hypothetical protein
VYQSVASAGSVVLPIVIAHHTAWTASTDLPPSADLWKRWQADQRPA